MSGMLHAIYRSSAPGQPMTSLEQARVITDFGLEGDRKARKGSKRQLLVMPLETLEEYDLQAGSVRENLTLQGIDVMALPAASRLQIGDVIIEATQACAPCSFMDDLRPGLQEAMQDCRGMLFRVIHGGQIAVGDTVILLET